MVGGTLARFRQILTERFGWKLDDDADRLSVVATARLRTGQGLDEYVASLAALPPDAPEFRGLAQALAVSETYFFRNREQFDALIDVALPAAIDRAPSGPIRMLSAGCATGEEPYSLAIASLQLQARRAVPQVDILGVDLSARALDRARANRYSKWALRGVSEDVVRRFFTAGNEHYSVRPEVRRLVRLEECNLLTEANCTIDAPWDVVFFRNTGMYFTVDAIRTIVDRLAARIVPGGYLFLGHAENLRGVSDAFELMHTHDTFYYLKRASSATVSVRRAPAPAGGQQTRGYPERGDRLDLGNDQWIHEIGRATERVTELADGVQAESVAEAGSADRRATERPAADSLALPLSLLAEERFTDALEAVGEGQDVDRLLLRAVLLTQVGRFDDAREIAGAVLAADATHAGAHYVLALCDERQGRIESAIAQDEMAVHLDRTFAMPHLHLGILARRRGDSAAAAGHMRQARDLLMREDSARLLLFGGGFGRHALLQMCDAHLKPVGRR